MDPVSPSVALALELSSRSGEIAIGRDGAVLDVEPIDNQRRHSDDLVPAIDRLCRRVRIDRNELTDVFVSVGPGGFTGLRISITTAKMLAYALGVRLVPVPTAAVVAMSTTRDAQLASRLPEAAEIAVCLASKHGQAWCSWFSRTTREATWTIDDASAGALVDPVELLKARTAHLVIADTPSDAVVAWSNATGTPLEPPRFDATCCLEIGATMLATHGEHACVRPQDLVPLYAREPEAVRKWRELHGDRSPF